MAEDRGGLMTLGNTINFLWFACSYYFEERVVKKSCKYFVEMVLFQVFVFNT